MKKIKLFCSICKERDWLEEMTAQGWMLTDIDLGFIYHFKQIEPAHKVFEIERFTRIGTPNKQMLTARTNALSLAEEFGWELVTHDEDMTYYFAKDKAGDESDEFYEDDDLRRERAEKFRRYYSLETPMAILVMQLLATLFFLILNGVYGAVQVPQAQNITLTGYAYLTVFLVVLQIFCHWLGERRYHELCMSRAEWEERKSHSQKQRFFRVDKLLDFLRDRDGQGLALVDYQDGAYLFEPTQQHYFYTFDACGLFRKRMRSRKEKYRNEKKDWMGQSLRWYEMSIKEAADLGLEPVCVAQGDILIYRSTSKVQLNDNEKYAMGFSRKIIAACVVFAIGMIAGFGGGYLCGRLAALFLK